MNLDPPPQIPLDQQSQNVGPQSQNGNARGGWIWQKWLNNLYEHIKENSVVDYNLEVLRGNVTGHSMVSIQGHDATLTTTRTTITPTTTTVNIDQSGIDRTSGTPATVKVSSTDANDTSAGTGLRTMLLIGLSATGEVQTETITMNGQTEVASANTYSAINGWRAITWGSGTSNAGTIWVGTGTVTSGIPATHYYAGEIAENRGNTAYYVVPLAHTLYLRQLTLNVATTNKDVQFFIESSVNGVNWFTEANFAMEPGEFQGNIIAVPGLTAGMHVRIEGVSSASGTDVISILGCELVAN